jgi:hypothetical protein
MTSWVDDGGGVKLLLKNQKLHTQKIHTSNQRNRNDIGDLWNYAAIFDEDF